MVVVGDPRDADGTKAGVAAEANAAKASGMGRAATMTVEEARQILGVEPNTPPEEVMKVGEDCALCTRPEALKQRDIS
jgi:hypothetical protein